MIHEDVESTHLAWHADERKIIRRFEPDFDVTWGKRLRKLNANFSLYFLKPLNHLKQLFGFQQEVMLVISTYAEMQARLVQAIEGAFHEAPALGRVDQTVVIVLSAAPNAKAWMQDYTAQNPQSRSYVCLPLTDVVNQTDPWFIRNALMSQLFARDLFDYTLPLDNDLFFFGRQTLVAEHIDAIRRSENRGLFGLRKTGKTSVLFKIMRTCKEASIPCKYYDCKTSSIYGLSGDALLDRISGDIVDICRTKVRGWKSKLTATERFMSLVERLPEDLKICLIFDEVEYISVNSMLALHWSEDFVPFWQTVWSAQSQFRKFCFIIAGVNASVSETDRINGVQNPLFSIVRSRYLTGFDQNELHSLISVFGREWAFTLSMMLWILCTSATEGIPF